MCGESWGVVFDDFERLRNAADVDAILEVRDMGSTVYAGTEQENKIVMSESFIRFLDDENLVNACLAHELAHYVLKHVGKTTKMIKEVWKSEYDADVVACIILDEVGFNPALMADALHKFLDGGEDANDELHPPLQSRIDRIFKSIEILRMIGVENDEDVLSNE